MEDWQQRVVEERDQLGEKIDKLKAFLDNNNKIDEFDFEILDLQLSIMQSYAAILNSRISRFNN